MSRNPNFPVPAATSKCKAILHQAKLDFLSSNCPGLHEFDWSNYLDCSQCRIEKVLAALDHYFAKEGEFPRVLDFGSWLGNFSLALNLAGYNVTAAEMWARYSPSLDLQKRLLADNKVDCIDMSMIVGRPQAPRWNAVLFMAVIEHLSDSPRKILEILNNAMLPGGILILDTPNLAYLPNRRALTHGRSPYVPIEQQFYTAIPFEGHVREYTASELQWMLERTGFEVIETDFFNYSPPPLSAIPLLDHIRLFFPPYMQSPILDRLSMAIDKTMRELIFIVARKK